LNAFLSSLITPEPLGSEPRILVLQLNRIGDLVLTTPALQALRDTWPRCHITLVVSESAEELLPALPKVDDCLVYRRSLRANRPVFTQLLRGRFDICLDFTGTDRSALLSVASRAKRRVAFNSAKKGPLRALVYQHFVQVEDFPAHELDRIFQLTRPVGVASPSQILRPVLSVPPISRQRVGRLLKECGVLGDFALIHPGSAAQEKYWLPERWAEVILGLQHRLCLPCVLTGGADPFEQEHLRSIQTALAVLSTEPLPFPLVTLAGFLDLTLLTALAERARIVVSCDTAVVHIASAFSRPQVTLFGPTNPFHWHPRHPDSIILAASCPEAPLEKFDPLFPAAPMSQIPSAAVLSAAASVLMKTARDDQNTRPSEPSETA
jgi:ADP-heptose:LPS heptosyltransferase